MKERPILFSAPMVRALLAGTKTQTRRVLKQAIGPSLSVGMDDDEPGVAALSWLWGDGPGHDVHETIKRVRCPYGQPGDRLWVRETHVIVGPGDIGYGYWTDVPVARYRANDPELVTRWSPSIHMPRWASRITLEITAVRVERLNSISEADARAEGAPGYEEGVDIPPPDDGYEWSHYAAFPRLWESINGPGSWLANPWVWVISFQRTAP